MATEDEVESTLMDLVRRLERIDPSYRAMLPSRRTIEATCPDLGLSYHAYWNDGQLSEIFEGESLQRPDIRIRVSSQDLLAMAAGELTFRDAYLQNRVELRASMTDLLRLRAVL